ncbi:unnamed protein product [Closterium sp. NIES-54]
MFDTDSYPYVIRTGDCAGRTCGKIHTQHHCFSRLDDAWRAEFGDEVERPRWADLLRSNVAIFDLDFDVILSAMYALSSSAEGDCYLCVPPDLGIAATALGASEPGTLPGTAPAEAFHTNTLDSGASRYFFRDCTTLPPLLAPVQVRLADPSEGPVVARSSTVLLCLVVPSDSLSGLHLPSFSTNLVSTVALHDAMVTTTTPKGQRVSICTCTRTGHHLATFTRRPGSSLYTLATEPPQVAVSAQVSTSLPPLLPSPAPPCLPCVKGRQRAAPHSSSFPPTIAPLQTLHIDVWGPAHVSGQGRERYFLLVVDHYTRYTTVFPLRSKGEVVDDLIPWIRTVRVQLRERFGQDLPVLRLNSDKGVMELNLWPRVSLPETSPTLRWTREVGDVSVFRFWGSRAFVRDTSVDRFSARAIPCVILGFVPYAPGLQFTTPPHAGPSPSTVSQVDPLPGTVLVEVAVGSGASPVAASGSAASGGAEPGGAGSEGAGSWGAEPGVEERGGAFPEGVDPGGAELEGAESGGAEPWGVASSGGPASASLRLSPQQLREWLVRRARLQSGATGAGGAGDAGAEGAGVAARSGGTGGTTAGAGGACTMGAGAAGTGGVGGARAGDPMEPGAAGAGGSCAGAAGAGAFDLGAGGAGDTVRPRPYFIPLLQQRASRPVSPVCTARCLPCSRPPPVLGTHAIALCPSFVPMHVSLLAPPESSLPEVSDPEFDRTRTASPTVSRLLTTAVTNTSFECAAASVLVAELLEFAGACRLDYATAFVAEFASASPPSVGGECALGTDVLEDTQEDFECRAAAVPRFASMLLAPEGDLDAPDIPTPRSYAEAITGPYSSQWQAAMDAEMASWKSTGTYLDERFGQDLPVVRLHSDRGGKFSFDLLRDFCRGEGILQSFPIPDSPQQNGIAEHRIGLTSPTLRWTEKVGDASVFRVWGSRAFVRDMSADKLSARAFPCVFLGFSPDATGWQFYHPTSRRVFPSYDITFDKSVPFYRLFPYRSAPPPPPPLFLAPGPPRVDPLPGTALVEVAVGSGAAIGTASGGAASGGVDRGGAESEGAGFGGAEPGGAESEGVGSGVAEPGGALLLVERTRLRSGAAGAGDFAAGDTGAGGAGVTAGAGGTGGAAAAGPGGARTGGTGAARTGGVGGAGVGDPMEPGAAGAGGAGAVGAGAGGTGAGGAGSEGAGAVDPGAGGVGGTVRPRPYFVPLL